MPNVIRQFAIILLGEIPQLFFHLARDVHLYVFVALHAASFENVGPEFFFFDLAASVLVYPLGDLCPDGPLLV